MKKIYLMGITAAFAMSVNAQTTLKIKRAAFSEEMKNSSSAKPASPMQIGANITCTDQYNAGLSQTFNLTLNITNAGNEYGDSLSITFPAGFAIASAMPNDSIGVSEAPTTTLSGCPTTASGTKEPFRGIFGQNVVWGNNDNCYGGMPSGTNAGSTMTISVNAMVASGTTGPQTVNFFISGDGYAPTSGTPPAGDFSGSFIINPAGTPVVDMSTRLVQPTGITAINNCALGTQTIIARVINKGNSPESNVVVNYNVNNVAAIAIVIPGPIAVGDSVTFAYPVTYDFSPSNVYLIKSWVAQSGDISLTNDTASISISNTIPTALTNTATPYINGIESAYDLGSINKTWIGSGLPFGSSTTKHTGAKALFYTVNMTTVGAPAGTYEALNVFPCVDVTNGDTYKISFWKKALTATSFTVNGQTAVFTGTAQTAAAMTTVLKPYSALTPTSTAGTWTKDSVNFVATATETRYFAIGGKGTLVTTADQINVRLDDILITKIAGSVGIKTISSTEAISIFPNPTSGILNINAIEVNSSIEVLNVIGEKVYSGNLVKGNNTIDLSNLSNGAYFVKMNSNNQVITKKVVLSK